ncbi:MAG TPA: maleylpyruvate isomerase N-terminal domain-containing protein [Pyrinomonadaceae bacterium]|nr:maleylpyruvate isomerase N-terminal domain-containing protein [Pyrinomonadaceae bacterium]
MSFPSSGSDPILCAPLLRRVDEKLFELLLSLPTSEWDAQTVAPRWKVRDVAAHLLDTVLRKLSMVRDSWYVERVDIRSPRDLVALVNRLNQEGVTVYRRLSPPVLIDMMKLACEQSASFHESLDPFAPAAFGVSWAGETRSPNWFDTARELTERWHHQQQIRVATDRPGIMTPELYHPVLDCFLRGLPHLYRDTDAASGTVVLIEITGDCGGHWFLAKQSVKWELVKEPADAATRITIPQEIAWRVFTRGIDRDLARQQIKIEGDPVLGNRVLELTAVIA